MKTTKIKSSLIALVIALVANSNAAIVNIGPSFSSSANALNFESSVSTITPTLGSLGILVNKTLAVGDTFTYTFASSDFTNYLTSSSLGFTTLGFAMTGTSAAPAAFSLDLYGLTSTSEVAVIQSFSGYVPMSSASAFVGLTAGTVGDLSVINNVVGFGFTFNVGDIAVNTTLNSLQADIPEPSSASLLALGMAGLVALRARRKS